MQLCELVGTHLLVVFLQDCLSGSTLVPLLDPLVHLHPVLVCVLYGYGIPGWVLEDFDGVILVCVARSDVWSEVRGLFSCACIVTRDCYRGD